MTTQAWTRFGSADLSNCEREGLHLTGSIQGHGALLVLDSDALVVRFGSANTEFFVGEPIEALVGRTLESISPSTVPALEEVDTDALRTIPHVVPFESDVSDSLVGHVHESPDGWLLLEIEPATPKILDRREVLEGVERLQRATSMSVLLTNAAKLVRSLSGYDRAMVYTFDSDGHGAIRAEAKRDDLEAFLGQHYPASDIPQIARQLYLKNRIRTLIDVDFDPVPIRGDGPADPSAVDLSLARLRSHSPIHIQYLQNMGVGATLVASLVVEGELWGLIACHHYGPMLPGHDVRAACELIAEVLATKVVSLETASQAAVELLVRRLEQRMIESIARSGQWLPALLDESRTLLKCVDAAGAALVYDGAVHTLGDVPSTPDIRAIANWLAEQDPPQLFATHRLSSLGPFEYLNEHAAGVLAARISSTDREFLMWFRPEQIHMVTWGGNPTKPVELDSDDPATLSPRRSFAAWHQLVEGSSRPWTKVDRGSALAVGTTVIDVILQFRSVRLLLAHSRIERTRRQVEEGDAPVFVVDRHGRRIVANRAFRDLLGGREVDSVDELTGVFTDVAQLGDVVRSVAGEQRAWRGKVELAEDFGGRPVLLRADPVFDELEESIGILFLFIDLSRIDEVESARRRFQKAVEGRRRDFQVRRGTPVDSLDQHLFDRVLENASLAALEVVGSVEVESIPKLLETLQTSLRRSADLLVELARETR